MSEKFTCPRRAESGLHLENSPFKIAGADKDEWRKDGTCSYCGSMNQDKFMEYLEAGSVTLGPTDKSYKVYVEGVPNPNAGKPVIRTSASGPKDYVPEGKGWIKVTPLSRVTLPHFAKGHSDGSYVKVEPDGPHLFSKFYFQHLSQDQMIRFVELLNAQKLNIGYPGHFYTKPFFIAYRSDNN